MTAGTYNAPPSGEISQDSVVKALKQCIAQHPTLGAVIQDAATEKPQVARAKAIDLTQHFRFHQPQDEQDDNSWVLQRFLEDVHNESLDKGDVRPRWRLDLLPLVSNSTSNRRYHVAFAASHALTDGLSGFAFHRAFMEALQQIESLEFDAVTKFEPSIDKDIPLPLERIANLSISWSYLLRPLLAEYLPTVLAKLFGFSTTETEDMWCGAKTRPKSVLTAELPLTAAHVCLVSSSILQQVLKVCRSHDARLTGLLNHLAARALAKGLKGRGQTYNTFVAQTPIDLRKAASIETDRMGNYMSGNSETIVLDPNDNYSATQSMSPVNWEAVQHSTQSLGKISNTLADQQVGLLRYLSDYRGWTIRNASKPSDASFSVSNLGVFDQESSAEVNGNNAWSLEEMAFSQSADGTGAPLAFNVSSAINGPLAMVATWWPGE